jgi:shikimate dehydrogenase
MQNAGIASLGLDWRYLAFPVHPDQLRQAIAGAQAMKFVGLNLTVPHKLLALDMVDALDASAQQWGAVNTIRFEAKSESGEWTPLSHFDDVPNELRTQGFNTDADAITRSLKEDLHVDLRNTRTLLLGAGGAGRVAALKLAAEGVRELFLLNRTTSKAEELAVEIRGRFPAVQVHVGYPNGKVDLMVNATSLGLRTGDPLPLDTTRYGLANCAAVYDMIYRPAETPLLAAAKAAGCRVSNGIGMLLYQGAAAMEIWSGRTAPVAVMREALLKNVYGV